MITAPPCCTVARAVEQLMVSEFGSRLRERGVRHQDERKCEKNRPHVPASPVTHRTLTMSPRGQRQARRPACGEPPRSGLEPRKTVQFCPGSICLQRCPTGHCCWSCVAIQAGTVISLPAHWPPFET